MKLTDQDIIAPFIGKAINHRTFDELACDNRNGYVIYSTRYLSSEYFRDLFGITGRIKEQWEYSGIDFNLHLSHDSDIIIKGHLDKYRQSGGGHGRPVIHVLTPTQQELRVARRILQYITK